jgi:hypothetical protein
MDVTDLQARIAENIKVLLATSGISSQAALARGLGWEAAKVSRLLKGKQEWTLSDLIAVGEALKLDDPLLIARPLAEVVGAVAPLRSASGDTETHTSWYMPTSTTPTARLAQVIAFPGVYQTVNPTSPTTDLPVTRLGASQKGRRADTA